MTVAEETVTAETPSPEVAESSGRRVTVERAKTRTHREEVTHGEHPPRRRLNQSGGRRRGGLLSHTRIGRRGRILLIIRHCVPKYTTSCALASYRRRGLFRRPRPPTSPNPPQRINQNRAPHLGREFPVSIGMRLRIIHGKRDLKGGLATVVSNLEYVVSRIEFRKSELVTFALVPNRMELEKVNVTSLSSFLPIMSCDSYSPRLFHFYVTDPPVRNSEEPPRLFLLSRLRCS